jgi:hypothetical protein
MGSLLDPAIRVGPVVLGVGLVVAVVCLALGWSRAGGGPRTLRRALLCVALGAAGYAIGTAVGIGAFCAAADAGNLCGLGGVFGAGPAAAGICMAGYAALTLRASRSSPG